MSKVAVIGAGVIGSSWAALFLSRGQAVRVHDPVPGAQVQLEDGIRDVWPSLAALGASAKPPLKQLSWCDRLADAVDGVDFVQENGPENAELKQALVAAIDAAAAPDAVIASSSSGITPSQLQATCAHPDRVLVGHPFNPAALVPLVEVVPGQLTSQRTVDAAMSFYESVGKRPIHVRQELPGHVVNRLQAALWREAYSLVEREVVTVAEIDAAIVNGPGLRWSVVGPFAGQHLSGGAGGISRTLEHLGPPMVSWWHDLGNPTWTSELIGKVVAQTELEFGGESIADVAEARDRLLVKALAARRAEKALPI
jgi:carnitine 3-dehydrogenase